METKKNPKADLESKRSLFFQIGLVVALGASLAAFEWSSSESTLNKLAETSSVNEEEDMVPLITLKEKLPEIPKVKSLEFLIVEDISPITDDGPVIDTEDHGQEVVWVDVNLKGEGDDDSPIPFVNMEKRPEFPGGMDALLRYVASQINYPIICAESGIQGTVYVSFVIDKTGKVVDVQLLRGVHTAIDREAMRVISGMPTWTPGRQRDKPVKVSFQMPVKFLLQ